MRPFLLLASRAEDLAADEEYAAFLRLTGLSADELRRVRMEAGPLPDLRLDDYSGVFVGGGPFNSSDPAATKSVVQRRVAFIAPRERLRGGAFERARTALAAGLSGTGPLWIPPSVWRRIAAPSRLATLRQPLVTWT